MKKKILAAFLAAVSCMAMSVTAMAAERHSGNFSSADSRSDLYCDNSGYC